MFLHVITMKRNARVLVRINMTQAGVLHTLLKNPPNGNTRVYVRCCSDLQDFSSYPVGLQKLPLHSFCMSNGIFIQWVDSKYIIAS